MCIDTHFYHWLGSEAEEAATLIATIEQREIDVARLAERAFTVDDTEWPDE